MGNSDQFTYTIKVGVNHEGEAHPRWIEVTFADPVKRSRRRAMNFVLPLALSPVTDTPKLTWSNNHRRLVISRTFGDDHVVLQRVRELLSSIFLNVK